MNKLIICDLDGTLVDSLNDIHTAANAVRSHYGYSDVTRDSVRSWIGNGVHVLVEQLMADTTIAVEDALADFRRTYEEHMLDTTRPFPGIIAAMDRLIREGFAIGVLSNKGEQACRKVLQGIPELGCRMSFIYGGDSFPERKPSPVPIRRILQETRVPMKCAVMLGDSPNDISSGKAAGTHTIGVLYGYTDADRIRSCRPDRIVEQAQQLPEHVCELFQGIRCR